MTAAALAKLVSVWQTRLGLGAWSIDVKFAAVPESCYADTVIVSAYDVATMTFAPGSSEWNDRLATQIVVHELLHLATRDCTAVVDAARTQLHPQAAAQVEARWDHELEGLVDRLACRIADLTEAP